MRPTMQVSWNITSMSGLSALRLSALHSQASILRHSSARRILPAIQLNFTSIPLQISCKSFSVLPVTKRAYLQLRGKDVVSRSDRRLAHEFGTHCAALASAQATEQSSETFCPWISFFTAHLVFGSSQRHYPLHLAPISVYWMQPV